MNMRLCVGAYIAAVLMLSFSSAAVAAVRVEQQGTWPSDWPASLEPLRGQTKTYHVDAPPRMTVYEISFSDRATFERHWPVLLCQRSRGGILTVRSIEPAGAKPLHLRTLLNDTKPMVRLYLPLQDAAESPVDWPHEPWAETIYLPNGDLPEFALVSPIDGTWVPADSAASFGPTARIRTDIEVVADGKVIDLNRVALPNNLPIIDMRRDDSRSHVYQPQFAVQLFVWMQDRGKNNKSAWDDLDNVLAEVKAAGANAIEAPLDWFETESKTVRFKRLLDKHRVRLIGLYTGGLLHDSAIAPDTLAGILLKAQHVNSFPNLYINVNPDPLVDKQPKDGEMLAKQTYYLNELGKLLTKQGIQLLVHQHDPAHLHGGKEFRYHTNRLDPATVGFCFDVHWAYRAGEDPLALMKPLGRRVKALHIRNSTDSVWQESFGPGDIDYQPIVSHLRDISFDGYVVLELAHEAKTPDKHPLVEDVRKGLDYARQLFEAGPKPLTRPTIPSPADKK